MYGEFLLLVFRAEAQPSFYYYLRKLLPVISLNNDKKVEYHSLGAVYRGPFFLSESAVSPRPFRSGMIRHAVDFLSKHLLTRYATSPPFKAGERLKAHQASQDLRYTPGLQAKANQQYKIPILQS
ncbi:hypothetical protein FPE49_002710 [Salmonella bongori]|uniref:Uncharacterized protein n=1 Tax=Salmonella bongori TaxID=54736 RepID=A0A8F8FNQ1_SALBN|nr:hypothetical protein [Salmonella bongori]ECG1193517.1 hypothetical protein [Salmonella bongori]EDP8624483.1 hypothetical protein [Salmonella bongori]QXY85236.1 hypothetical protein EWI73_15540 [Salmonella bongori]